jgi:lysophospholipase L1-like esterase
VTGRLWVLGDSWSDPRSYPWAPSGNWCALLTADLGVGLVNSAVSGAGYVQASGTPIFPAQAAQGAGAGADVVIVFGGVNDSNGNYTAEQIRAGAATTYGYARRLCPDAPLLVAGPQWGAAAPFPAGFATAQAAIRAAAAAAGADYLDVSQLLIGRPDLALDQYHPNPAGHAYLAQQIGHDVALAFARSTVSA